MPSLSKSKSGWVPAVLLLLFLTLRLLVLFTGATHAFETEELYRGVIAREILSGLKMPLFDYQADHYSGGSLLTGLAAAPFFVFLGPSLFSLKLSPLLFAFLTLIFLWVFMRRNFGTKAAGFTALFFIFAPPSFVRLSLVAMGFHSESILFSVLSFYFFYRYFYEDKKPHFLFFFGLSAGLGFWYTHITVLAPAACVAAWVLLSPRSFFTRRALGLFGGGVLLGVVPWLAYNLTHGFEGAGFILKMLLRLKGAAGDSASPAFNFDWARLGELVLKAVPMSFAFEGMGAVSRRGVNFFYYGAGLLVFLPLYARAAKDRLLPVLLFPLIFIAAYWLSSLEMTAVTEPDFFYLFFDDCRYFVPFHLSFFMLLGIACAQIRLGKIAAVFFAGMGVWGLSSIVFLEPWGSALHYKGYSYSQLGAVRGHVWPNQFSDFEAYLKSLERYPMPDRFFVLWHSLHGLQFEKDLKDPEKITRLLGSVSPEYRPHMAEGVGYGIGAQEGERFDPADPAMKVIPKEFRRFFYFGFAGAMMSGGVSSPEPLLRFAEKLETDEREAFYYVLGDACPYARQPGGIDSLLNREQHETEGEVKFFFQGIGVRSVIGWRVEGFSFAKAVQNLGFEIPKTYQEDFYRGAGRGLCHHSAEDLKRGMAVLNDMPAEGRPQALAGFQDCLKAYAVPQ